MSARRACAVVLALATLGAIPAAAQEASGPHAPLPRVAVDALQRAETEHSIVRVTTAGGDTIAGRIVVDGDELRLLGGARRVSFDEVTSVARGVRQHDDRRLMSAIGVGTGLLIASPLILLGLTYSLPMVALGAATLGAVLGGVSDGVAGHAQDLDPGTVSWETVWQSDTPDPDS